jgi:hypothetical protein
MKMSRNQELPDNEPQNMSRDRLILQLVDMWVKNPGDFHLLLADVYLIADELWKDSDEAHADWLADSPPF